MAVEPDILSGLFSLPPGERFILAHQLLDSIDESETIRCDEQFALELKRRRAEMMRGEEVVPDWRAALSEIERTLSQ
jgi:Putative addiction module component